MCTKRSILCFALATLAASACVPRLRTTDTRADAGAPRGEDAGVRSEDAAHDSASVDASTSMSQDAATSDAATSDAGRQDEVDASPIMDAAMTPIHDGGAAADAAGHMSAPDGGMVFPRRDECQVDADCASGTCQALPEAAHATRYCLALVQIPRVPCESRAGLDSLNECCADEECTSNGNAGVCTDFSFGYCGGAAPPEANICRFHECGNDIDCGPDRACMPAGAFGAAFRTCVQARCRSDLECSERSGGQCRPMRDGPCGSVTGFFCTYDDDPCRADTDCPSSFGDGKCIPSDQGTRCEEYFPPP